MMRSWWLAGVFAFGSAASAVAAPITYDAVTDFSTASNPNGVWQYGYGTASANALTFTDFTTSFADFGGNAGYDYWGLSANNVPLVGRNTQGTMSNGTYQPLSNELWLHPGNADDQSAIVRFTAAFTGSYSLADQFRRADNVAGGGNGVQTFVYKNGTLLDSQMLPATTGSLDGYAAVLSLTAGDTVSFVVGRNGEYSYDSTGLRASITADPAAAIPEPATVALFGLGIVGLLASRRRRA